VASALHLHVQGLNGEPVMTLTCTCMGQRRRMCTHACFGVAVCPMSAMVPWAESSLLWRPSVACRLGEQAVGAVALQARQLLALGRARAQVLPKVEASLEATLRQCTSLLGNSHFVVFQVLWYCSCGAAAVVLWLWEHFCYAPNLDLDKQAQASG
jgi:hypothetical protein